MNNIITCALPYANGNLHIGHFFEAVCADIKARYLKKINTPYCFVSGDDCHGAATTLYCHKNNLDIQEHLSNQYIVHKQSYDALKIQFNLFSKTNTLLHKEVVRWCIENIITYEKNNSISLLETRDVQSWFDSSTQQFLPDRYVKGQCPHCNALNQHPEICENCNVLILPENLIAPASVLNQQPVNLKLSKHLTLNTKNFYEHLLAHQELLHPSIKNKVLDPTQSIQSYIDISRDGPYYGIKIENFEQLANQYFYVWFDAPIAYLTFAYQYSLNGQTPTKDSFDKFLSNATLEHFIGKDIAYFHTFLWINLLKLINSSIKIKKINFHGWLTLNKLKFSKSKGHQFDLSQYNNNQIDALRLYFFSKQDGSIQDTELLESEVYDFYNQTIVNGLANFYARSIKLAQKNKIGINYKTDLNQKYTFILESGNYKKLYETINTDLRQLNADFQNEELWTKKQNIGSSLQVFLNRWFDIYQILVLVCPGLSDVKNDIEENKFIHIAKPLPPFSLFKDEL